MNNYSIVIPSRNRANLAACIGAIRKRGVNARVVVVWDETENGGAAAGSTLAEIVPAGTSTDMPGFNVRVVTGAQPFCFGRNVNLGIAAAGTDDVIILNDDANLATHKGFDHLADAAQKFEIYGLVAPMVSGTTCNQEQRLKPGVTEVLLPQNRPFATKLHMIPFVAVYIRREVLNLIQDVRKTECGQCWGSGRMRASLMCGDGPSATTVCSACRGAGPLSERFFGHVDRDGNQVDPRTFLGAMRVYGGEDDEMCYQLRRAGFTLGLLETVVVDHSDHKRSTFRANVPSLPVAGARAVFIRELGFDMGDK